MHRREFICGVAGTVAGAPSLTLRVASAQQAAKVRRIGVLMGSSESDLATFLPHSWRNWHDWVGRMAATRGSSSGGQTEIPTARVLSRRS